MIESRKNQELTSNSAEETLRAGSELAAQLKSGDLISFSGALGAGKTCFIKGIARGLGIDNNDVKSPSFTLVNEYHGRKALYHFDLYRMNKTEELYEIGWDDYLMRDGIVVVEWGEKAEKHLPLDRIDISIEIITEFQRGIKINFLGD